MRRNVLAACLVLVGVVLPTIAYAGSAQFTLQNNIDRQLNLFVDDQYACGPVMTGGGTCTTQITPDVTHKFEARSGMDPSTTVKTETGSVPEGGSPTMVVCFLDPRTGRCPGY